jgi:uncharacterized phage protein (TIGR02218 family)
MKVVELYKIVVNNIGVGSGGGSETFHWTNSDEEIEYEGDTYVPEVVSRSDMVQNNEINRQDIQLTIAPDNPLAEIYYKNPPEAVATVTVFRGEQDSSTSCFLTYWKGRIVSTRSDDWNCIVECESVFTSMRRTGARARYQVQCRHALYGTACGVNKDNYEVLGTVSAVGVDTLTVTGADSQDDGYFVGGMVERDGIFRFIVGHTGTTIRLWRQFNEVEVSDSVKLYPGCNRTLTVCDERFNNALNYGGFPWLPNTNPFQNVNLY